MPLEAVHSPAPEISLRGEDDRAFPLADAWRDRAAVLVFLRHFGWPFCRKHLVQVQEEKAAFDARGASVLAIGQGTGEQAADYADRWGIGFPILGDPKAAAYQAFGMLRGNWWTVLGRSLVTDPLETIRLTLQADMKGAALPAADVLRLPGVAIVSPGGTLRFVYKSQEPSDLPPNAEVLAALDSL